jgi:aminopeptidase N
MKKILTLFPFCLVYFAQYACAQPLHGKKDFTRQDTLRGTINAERAWWDVLRYDIEVTPNLAQKSISGKTIITYKKVSDAAALMQIDLQEPMVIDSVVFANAGSKLYLPQPAIKREGNVYHIPVPGVSTGNNSVVIYFHGTPRAAVRPPWDGGWIWRKDEQSRPWISVACQGLGASVWFPCKDHQSDEPDHGASLTVNVPKPLVAVANGKLKNHSVVNGLNSYTWEVKNPINNYNIIPYIGHYVNFSETFTGEKGALNCSYWVLDYNLEKAKKQFTQVALTLKAFEHWFGPFPWYEDDFKLVEAPHLGMEHQSAVAYGNKYQNGYLGNDLSGTGVGKQWDFIIVHEVGHEWFGNNITTKDLADMWVHEGFTSYSETLFSEFHFGKAAASSYVQGIRRNISNDLPIIGPYGVNMEGSGDMYYKGSNMLHTIRQIINDDALFRDILRGLNKDFYHQTVTSAQVEQYISQKSGKDFSKVFDQYLRRTNIPVLQLESDDEKIEFRWKDCVEGFNMPVRLTNGEWIYPTTEKGKVKGSGKNRKDVTVDPNFYIKVERK